MPQFRRSRSKNGAPGIAAAGACLPGLNVKFVHQRAVAGKACGAATDWRECIAFAAQTRVGVQPHTPLSPP
jgi:hypothetical protein